MSKISTIEYKALVSELIAAGFDTDTVYPALEECDFQVELEDGTILEGIYASRVIAMMHDSAGKAKPLSLKKAKKKSKKKKS